jgi:hypothetical protein
MKLTKSVSFMIYLYNDNKNSRLLHSYKIEVNAYPEYEITENADAVFPK